MNNPETHSLGQEGDPVQPTKATKRAQTHSLKIEGDSVLPTKATKKTQTHRPSAANKGDQETTDTLTQA